ncbi:hypothetical protein PG997_010175 [Apiospora hydei]|uniref:Uncharacterized protein n=1 Tax=Apiospora hydei TaxID=1337664 RepID=A0ABR1VWB0_9PEZI
MASHQATLNEDNKRLMREIAKLKLENGILRRRVKPSAPRNVPQLKEPSETTDKSYLRPTIASLNREKGAEEERPAPTKPAPTMPQVTYPTMVYPYMQHTVSSYEKAIYGSSRNPRSAVWGSSEDGKATMVDCYEDESNLWGTNGFGENPWEESSKEPPAPLPAPVPAEEVEALKQQTRLCDSSWENPAASYMVIPSVIGYRLLSEALSGSKGAFHDFCKRRGPRLWRCEFPGGPQEVRFEAALYDDYRAKFDIPGVPIYRLLDGARKLRNQFSHFPGQSGNHAADYDHYIEYAQSLAVALNDAPRANRLQALRDELRVVAAETLREIENLGCASIACNPHYWEPHHDAFFYHFRVYRDNDHPFPSIDGFLFSPTIALAVQAHLWQNSIYGGSGCFLMPEESDQSDQANHPEATETPEVTETPEATEIPEDLS